MGVLEIRLIIRLAGSRLPEVIANRSDQKIIDRFWLVLALGGNENCHQRFFDIPLFGCPFADPVLADSARRTGLVAGSDF